MRTIHLSILALVTVLSGCQAGHNDQKIAQTQPYSTAYQQLPYNPVLSKHTAETAEQTKGVDEAVSVVIGKDITMALKVTGFDRFRLRGIKQEVSKKLKKDLIDQYTIHITTDKKLYRNLQSLKVKLAEGKEPPEKIMKTFKKVNKDMHG